MYEKHIIVTIILLFVLCIIDYWLIGIVCGGMSVDEQHRFEKWLTVQDPTDRYKYKSSQYMCLNFACQICNNARSWGFSDIYLVHIDSCKNYPGGHYIVALKLDNGNYSFYEPQTDRDITKELMKDGEDEHIQIIDNTKLAMARTSDGMTYIPPTAIIDRGMV